MVLENGLNYRGNYAFQQIAPPRMTVGLGRSGSMQVVVRFAGATPLLPDFARKIRAQNIPHITDNGVFGIYSKDAILRKLFTGFTIDDGKVWTNVDLNFNIPVTDQPTSNRESTTDESWAWQTVRVQGPGESYYEASYISPQSIHNRVSTSKPSGPVTTFAGTGEIQIVRDVLHTDPEQPPIDLTPKKSTRVVQYESREVIAGQLWEATSVVAKVLEDEDRS